MPPDEIGFVSGNAWDAVDAAEFGYDTYWISTLPFEEALRGKVLDIDGLHSLPEAIPWQKRQAFEFMCST